MKEKLVRDFVAVIQYKGSNYYALFTFDVSPMGVVANAEYVKSWPDHRLLEQGEGSDILDSTFDEFVGHMQAHIEKELQSC